jgi:uncharacterized phage infection (PIP) family protein YhgE
VTEQLSVDTSGLRATAGVLGDLDVPASPKPLTVTGTDAMSAAISEVLPTIETPVIDGLPVAEAALKKTATDMATAADRYDETDSASAGDITGTQFNSDDTTAQTSSRAAKVAATDTSAETDTSADTDAGADTATSGVSAFEQLSGQLSEQLDSLAEKLPSAEEAAQQLGQMAPMMGSVTQSLSGQVQGLMSKAQAGGQNPPAPPASDTTVEDAKAEEEQRAADAAAAGAAQEAAPQADGAAAGSTDGLRVPIAEPAPSAETLLPGATHGAME